MTVPCPHWIDLGKYNVGGCAKGYHKGRPSGGACYRDCKDPDSPCAKGLVQPPREPRAQAQVVPVNVPTPTAKPSPPPVRSTVGDEAAKIIGALGIKHTGCNSCEALIAVWNSYTAEQAREKIDEMEQQLLASAKQRKWTGIAVKLNEAAAKIGANPAPTAREIVERAIGAAKDVQP